MNKEALRKKINSIDALSKEEKAELTELLNTKRYGLVWEDKPEAVEEELKTQLPVLMEVTERKIAGSQLSAVGGQPATETVKPQISLDFGTNENVRTGFKDSQDGQDLMMDKNNPAHPVKSLNPVQTSSVNHALIEGDNLHALTVLNYTHANKIDVIYIDPPYNTGNKDFKYNDHFVDKEDGYRHSKWLSFMAKRLRLAKNLLSDKGVIFISIDDNEQAQLKLLCDEIFGEVNFVGSIIIETATDNNPSQISVEHEYLMCYSKNLSLQSKWIGISAGAIQIQNEYERLLKIYDQQIDFIKVELRKFIRQNKDNLSKVKHYSYVDEKGVYYPDNPSNTKLGGYTYEVIHPVTKGACALPTNGFRFPEKTFNEMVLNGNIDFGKDESIIPKPKRRLTNVKELLRSIYYEDGRIATGHLMSILGSKVFNNPKSINLIKHFISFIPDNQSFTVLDFFAGSGTTLHAVMALNAEDGGSRQCILVTNNENNICEEVTYERNKRVIEGYTNAKGDFVAGLGGNNLRYYRTGYVGRERTLKNKKALVNLATEMLCLKEGVYQEKKVGTGFKDLQDEEGRTGFKDSQDGQDLVEDKNNPAHPVKSLNPVQTSIRLFQHNDKAFMIIYDEEFIDEAVELIQQIEIPNPIKVYVFANGQYPYTEDFEEVLDKIELCALPDAIYRAYQRLLPKEESMS